MRFNDIKDSISSQVVLEVDKNDAILSIDADVIDRKKNIREEFHLSLNENSSKLYPKDSLVIKKALNLKTAKLWLEREDLSDLGYTKTFYKNNKPIEFNSFRLNKRNLDEEMKISKLEYLTENSGLFADGKTAFRLVNGEAVASFIDTQGEKFEYDEKGNWIKHEFEQFIGHPRTKAKRYIEYWD